MIEKIFFLLLFSFPAWAMPTKTLIKVNYHAGDIRYIHKNNPVVCSQNKKGSVILGCARDKKQVSMQVDCGKRLILVDVFSKDREIEIHSDLAKNSCEYNEVLDHEMTHMDLHAEALENILNQGMNNIVDAFNAQFKKGKGCRAATEAAQKAFDKFVAKYQKEDRRINQEFDRDDADSVLQNCKTPPKVRMSYKTPDIRYVPVKRAECAHKKIQCSLKNGKQHCEPIKMLSCTDMPVGFKTEIKTYLGLIDVSVLVPEITTKILSRYPANSCEYKELKNFELSVIDETESALYDFMEEAEPALKKAYNEALQKEYSGQELVDSVKAVLQEHIQETTRKIERTETVFRPVTERELQNLCAGK